MPAGDLQSEPNQALPADGERGVSTRSYGLWPKQWRWRISLVLLAIIALIALAAWLGREKIAADFIDDALAANGLEARYDIVSIGTTRQVIANLEIGDPEAPDFTAEQVTLDIAYTVGAPEVGGVELVKPRLYGQLRDGRVSFGSLDPLIYAESDAAPGLPSIDLTVIDGRALIESEFGAIGAKLDGIGRLDDGFAGTVAATAPGIGTGTCRAETATLYGDVTSASDQLSFDGPIRLRSLACEGANLAFANVGATITLAEDLASLEGDFELYAEDMSYADNAIAAVQGPAQLLWRFGGEEGQIVDFSHSLGAAEIVTAYASFGALSAEGRLRMNDDLTRSEWRSTISGSQIALAPGITNPLGDAASATEGTFIASLLTQFEGSLSSALARGELRGDVTVRSDDEGLRVIIPQARLRSASGEAVMALSRFNFASTVEGEVLSGNLLAGGQGLPLINGRMEQTSNGERALRLTMAEYTADDASLEIPRLELRQSSSGRVTFNGRMRAGGALPGGALRGLEVPVEGSWSVREGLALGRRCADVSIAALEFSGLALAERSVTLCPEAGSAMVRYRDALQVAAVSEALDITGIGGSPARITAERAELRYPEQFVLTGLSARIGEADNAVRLTASYLDGELGEEIGGQFVAGTAALDIVPLDLKQMGGLWSFTDGVLGIEDGTFYLSDRPDLEVYSEARFEPLFTSDARLLLDGDVIRANADLRHPGTVALVSRVTVEHNLSSGAGRADIAVPGVMFGDDLQPDDLSILTQGVVAAAEGMIAGAGEVRWDGDDLESSGTFRTDNFDFAAAFGPVRGVKGEINFTDLIELTTAPRQVLEIGSVNPGVEALGGRIVYSMTGGQLITVEDGRWPFMGGELILRPVALDYGGGDGQSYVFEIVDLDAATFVTQMEMTNLGASGTFDGTLPIFFDAQGNGSITGGLLIARPPGGNVSYVGELTYEDLGQMANYAFQSLRSLDYRQMSVELNGNLAGEIITNFQIDGVRQGEGASQNFVTRRLAELPIRFNINVRSDNFTNLALIVRGLFDPTVYDNDAVRRSLGLDVSPVESPLQPPQPPSETDEPDEALLRPEAEFRPNDESNVQPPESDELP